MPVDLIWEARGVYRRYHGDVTIAERRRSLEMICSDPRFDNLRYSITDSLAVTNYEYSPQSTELAAALHIGPLTTNPNILITAVAVDPKIVAAIDHFIAQGFVEPYRTFPTVDEARAWIAEQMAQPLHAPPTPRGR